jgi:hypothetical protein
MKRKIYRSIYKRRYEAIENWNIESKRTGGKRTQTLSDFVDSRRGGHEEQALVGSGLPIGLNNN